MVRVDGLSYRRARHQRIWRQRTEGQQSQPQNPEPCLRGPTYKGPNDPTADRAVVTQRKCGLSIGTAIPPVKFLDKTSRKILLAFATEIQAVRAETQGNHIMIYLFMSEMLYMQAVHSIRPLVRFYCPPTVGNAPFCLKDHVQF